MSRAAELLAADIFDNPGESERLFRGIFDQGPLGMLLVGQDWRIFKCNATFCRLLGYSEEELIGLSVGDLTHPGSLKRDRALANKLLRGELPSFKVEKRYIRKNGENIWVDLTVSLIRDKKGEPLYALGMVEDITQRHQAEIALKKKEATLAEAQQIAHLGSWERNLQTNELWCSDETYRIIGRTPAEFEATHEAFLRIVHPDDLKRIRSVISNAIQENKSYSIEYRIIRPDGAVRTLQEKGELTCDDHGAPLKVTGVVYDISARKLAEEELIRSLGWQQAIFEGSRDAIFITDANATLVDVNRAACMLSGYSKRELLTMRIPDLHEDIDLEAYRQFHDRIMAGEEIISEAQILKKDGSKVDAEFNNRRVVIAGRPYMHTVARDVAERKRAESELQKLTRAVEQSPVCVMITDTKGNIEYVNPRFSQLTGYTSAEVIGQTPRILKSGAQTTDFYKGLWKNISDGNEWRGEFCNKKKNGELYWEFASICSIRDQQRRITHFLAVKEDITERKRFESDLKKSEEKFRTLFEVSQDAVLITLPHGKILDINPAGVKMFGYSSREDFLAMGNAAALYAKPAERSPVVDLLTTQGFVKNYEVKLQKKNGAPLDVSLSSFAVRDEHGQIRFFCGNLHDLTQRKKIEHQLLQAQKMETIATLVSGIAHDFNNLLIAILGNIEFARADADANDPIQHYLQRVEVAAAKARDLINKLMSFSRQQALDPKPINLNRTIEDLLSMLQSMVGRDIGIETRLATPLPDIVADPVQFQQILMNLCVNARDAMPAGGRILLTTSRVDAAETKGLLHANGSRHYVLLTISDTGEGMDKEMLPRIFEPFFTTKEIGRGTGLGLSVVYGIVKQHKGYIEVESEKDKGTTFKIYFPAFLAAEDDTQRDSAEKMPEISSDDLNMALTKETIDGNGISN